MTKSPASAIRVLRAVMSTNGNIPLAPLRHLERTSASVAGVERLDHEIARALSALSLQGEKLQGRRIAITVGSRGVANLREIVRAICVWLKEQGARPFVFPAMGSHGGATAEGQSKILEEYGVTPDYIGAEIRSSMETVRLGTTPEGFQVFMDRNAWEADFVLVMNRVKPHTDFTGRIESGLLKMMVIGMGKIDGAEACHLARQKYGFEPVLRAVSAKVLASGKILCGLAVIENELHQIASVRAARPEGIVAQDEEALKLARALVPRIPFSSLQLLVVDELGKNISGCGMDTKIIGRGVELQPGDAPDIRLIYVRDITAESDGNAAGIGLADMMHQRLYQKIDLDKTYVNVITALNPPMARLPIHLPSDREAVQFALGSLGSPEPREQRIVWIRNTLNLDRLAISEAMAHEAATLEGWRLEPGILRPQFDREGNLPSPL